MSYHSSCYQTSCPTILHHCCSIDIEKPISIKGQSTGSQYDSQKHIYKVQNKIILRANGRKYILEEYHFHVSCEDIVNSPAEIHYAFHEIGQYQSREAKSADETYLSREDSERDNILVIGKVISSLKSHKREPVDLNRPTTTSNCYVEPVRWLVGDDPLRIDIEQVLPVYTLEDYKPPLAVQSSRETLPINELKRAQRVQI